MSSMSDRVFYDQFDCPFADDDDERSQCCCPPRAIALSPFALFRLGLHILAKNSTFNFCGLPANLIKPLPRCCHRLLAIAAE
jgi:hypothetical protein